MQEAFVQSRPILFDGYGNCDRDDDFEVTDIQIFLNTPHKTYPIIIEPFLLQRPNAFEPHLRHKQVALITNQTVSTHCLSLCEKPLNGYDAQVITILDGERHKTLKTVEGIFETLIQHGFDRSVTLIAFGGGVVGDVTGFSAACYLRGVSYLQVPTTLLAQVDAALGGKTGVNCLGKNLVGAIYHPEAVLIDPVFLKTLPHREYVSGLAEVVKYALLTGNARFFEWLEQETQPILEQNLLVIQEMIATCCREKIRIVEQDERDQSVRRLLNLGHTFGHAMEGALLAETWLHGEAISVGLLMAAFVSVRLGFLNEQTFSRIEHLLESFGLPSTLPPALDKQAFLTLMGRDKKGYEGKLRFVLLKGIGDAFITEDVPLRSIEETYEHFCL